MHTVRAHRTLACDIDCLDTMHIETRMDIGAETSYTNTGFLAHIDDERRAMIALFGIR